MLVMKGRIWLSLNYMTMDLSLPEHRFKIEITEAAVSIDTFVCQGDLALCEPYQILLNILIWQTLHFFMLFIISIISCQGHIFVLELMFPL